MNKGSVISRPAAQEALRDFIFAELYTDTHPENRKIQNERFRKVSLPLYVVLGPDGVERARLDGQISMDSFLAFLKKGLEPGPKTGSATPSK